MLKGRTIMGQQSNTLPVLPQKIITGQEDSGLDSIDAQFHAFSDTDPPTPGASITLTLPCNPKLGEHHTIVATTAAVNLDGGDYPVISNGAPFAGPIPVGSARHIVFSKDPGLANKNDCGCDGNGNGNGNGAGVWIVH
jgi:hypothetical protein